MRQLKPSTRPSTTLHTEISKLTRKLIALAFIFIKMIDITNLFVFDKITLQSNDGRQFIVPRDIIYLSKLLKEMLEDLPEVAMGETVPIPEIDGVTLEKVLQWCRRHCHDKEAITDQEWDEIHQVVPAWDVTFFAVTMDELFAIANAANYLEIQLLLYRACKQIADRTSKQTTQEMRNQYGVAPDFTPEEEELLRRENPWASDH